MIDQQTLSNMFGSYVSGVDAGKYGGYTQDFWTDALGKRVTSANPKFEGKPMVIDWGKEGLQYTDRGYAYANDGNDKPYNDEKLGFETPLGVWVYTGEGDPTKTTDKWKRGDDHDMSKYGWEFVSAFDPATMDVSQVDPAYRTMDMGALTRETGSDSAGNETTSLDQVSQFMSHLGSLSGVQRHVDTESGTSFWITSDGKYLPDSIAGVDLSRYLRQVDDGLGNSAYTADYQGLLSALKSKGVDVNKYFFDPTKASAGKYNDGREGVPLPSVMGYAPTTGYDYDDTGFDSWGGAIEGFFTRNAPLIAAAVFTAATAGMGYAAGAAATASALNSGVAAFGGITSAQGAAMGGAMSAATGGAIGGAVGGAITQGAITGQKTNDPWRIVAGSAAGAVAGAAPYVGPTLGVTNGLANVALSTGIGTAASAGGQYAATGSIDPTKLGIAALSAGIPALAQNYSSDISSFIQKEYNLDKATADTLTKQVISTAAATAIGGAKDGAAGAAAGAVGSVVSGGISAIAGGDDPLANTAGKIAGNVVSGITSNAMQPDQPATGGLLTTPTTPVTTTTTQTTTQPSSSVSYSGLLSQRPVISQVGPAVQLAQADWLTLPNFTNPLASLAP